MIIIGSKAIKHWFPDFKREPRDFDYVSRFGPITAISRIFTRAKNIPKDHHPIEPLYKFLNDTDKYLDANSLFTLKISHLSYKFKWDKTFSDCVFLAEKGCKVDYKLLKELKNFWKEQKTHKDNNFYTHLSYDEYPYDSKTALSMIGMVNLAYQARCVNNRLLLSSEIDGVNFMRGLKYYTKHVETKGQIFIIQNYKSIINQFKQRKK